MTEVNQEKYILVYDIPRVNELYTQGYTLKFHTVHTWTDDHSRSIMSKDQYLMSLSMPSKYDDIVAFKKAPITEDWQDVPDGVKIIHHTSKEMVLVKTTANNP